MNIIMLPRDTGKKNGYYYTPMIKGLQDFVNYEHIISVKELYNLIMRLYRIIIKYRGGGVRQIYNITKDLPFTYAQQFSKSVIERITNRIYTQVNRGYLGIDYSLFSEAELKQTVYMYNNFYTISSL